MRNRSRDLPKDLFIVGADSAVQLAISASCWLRCDSRDSLVYNNAMDGSDCDSYVEEAIKELLEQTPLSTLHLTGLKILAFGKSGIGKSTLINKFLSLPSAAEGGVQEAAKARRSSTSVTTVARCYKSVVKGVPIQIVDTPGLSDNSPVDRQIIQELVHTTREADLILYCASLQQRFDASDTHVISTLTKSLGKKIWEKAIFVLTNADVQKEFGRELDPEFQLLIDGYVQTFQNTLKRVKCTIPVKSIYSFQDGAPMHSICKIQWLKQDFEGIVTLPISNKINIPQNWKCALLLETIRKTMIISREL